MQPEVKSPSPVSNQSIKPIKIAILAMGGEGGGVLADWIVEMSEAQGYYAQSTSVPGVAQRTGATIYYVEVLPVQRTPGLQPVFSLMPTPGDVDVVIASELMESSRAVQRGLVTPEKTLLITSSSRVYAMPEKMAMGDGRVSSEHLLETGKNAARIFVARDFSELAERSGSVISATLFGALAASGSLPLDRSAFESAIERGGVGVKASLKAFGAGFNAFMHDVGTTSHSSSAAQPKNARLATLFNRIEREFPQSCRELLRHGVTRTADYQDLRYAGEYLDRLRGVIEVDTRVGQNRWTLSQETARYLALWMTFEDTARVAELKLRRTRFQRVQKEVRLAPAQLMHINEYFHPRVQELADTLPKPLANAILARTPLRALLERMTREGKVVRTSSLSGFMGMYMVASCRSFRRKSTRYLRETAAMHEWLDTLIRTASNDYALACEIAECQRLIKGYGDTHARGLASYERIRSAITQGSRSAAWVKGAREAALADDSGTHLDAYLGTAH